MLIKEYGLDMANLGVGTFSLLQVVRHFEKNVAFFKPKAALLIYGHWMVNRCFKDKAFMKGLARRPVFARKKGQGKLSLLECRFNPTTATIAAVHELRNKLIGNETFNLTYVWRYFRLQFIHWKTKRLRILVRQLTFERRKLVDDKENYDPLLREFVLRTCFNHLADAADAHGVKVLIYHMFEYRHPEKMHDIIVADDALIRELAAKREALELWDGSAEQARFDEYMEENELQGDYFSTFKLPDDIHHDRPGNKLMAATMFEALESHGIAFRRDGHSV